jgi:recombination protein RecT
MVKGIIKMILKNTDVVKVESACVFKKDGFEFELGTNPFIRHRPNLEVPITDVEKDFRCVWAIFTLSNGEKMYDVMPKHEVDRRRTVSTGKNLPFWTMWYDRMARKSVIHRLSEDLDFDIKFEVDPDDSNETQDLLPKLAKPTPVIALPELPTPQVTEDDLPFDVDEGDGF